MHHLPEIITYALLFLSLYFEVFILLTFIQKRHEIKEEEGWVLSEYPKVTILVPCFNEERTVLGTVNSLLNLNYPKDKLEILLIDDGSTDNTFKVISEFSKESQVKIFQKENGGKYTALNLGLEHTTSDFVGCLDADSFVHPDALKNIMVYFRDEKAMAVTPSLKIYNPNSVMRMVQNVEYNFGIFVRKVSSILNAIYVTPGPFSIFRTRVFIELGNYKDAHNTEDMEMALRLQANHYKIVNAHKAVVYTTGPKSLSKLYKQRVRWTSGFLQNIKDYKYLILNKKYGDLGMFILPLAFVSFFGTLYLILATYLNLFNFLFNQAVKFQTVGFHPNWTGLHFNWFFFNTETLTFINFLILAFTLTIIFTGKKLAGVRDRRYIDMLFSILLYSLVAPFWLVKSFYNVALSKKTTWR